MTGLEITTRETRLSEFSVSKRIDANELFLTWASDLDKIHLTDISLKSHLILEETQLLCPAEFFTPVQSLCSVMANVSDRLQSIAVPIYINVEQSHDITSQRQGTLYPKLTR